jgi:hypothetical protein
MLVGDLVVRIAADMAELRSGFEQARGSVTDFSNKASSAIDSVGNSLLALAGGYSLVETIRQTIEYGEQLQRLSDITGLAAAEVQKLSLIAKLNDTDAASLTRAWGNLVKQLLELGDSGEKARSILTALKVDAFDKLTGAVKPTNELMAGLASAFNAIQDPATRAKIASELFGKSYQDMLVILKNWNEDAEKVKQVLSLVGEATEESTQKADQFGDTLTLMTETTKALLLQGIGPLADQMELFRLAMLNTQGQGSSLVDLLGRSLATVVNGLTQGFIGLTAVIHATGVSLGGIAASIALLFAGEPVAASRALEEAWADVDAIMLKAGEDISILRGGVQSTTLALQDEIDELLYGAVAADDNGAAALRAASAQAVQAAATKAAAAEAKKLQDELDKLTEKWTTFNSAQDAGLAPQTVKDIGELNTLLEAGRIQWDQYSTLLDQVLAKDPILAAEQAALNKQMEAAADAVRKLNEERNNALGKVDEEIEHQQAANATYGMGRVALLDYAIAIEEKNLAVLAGIPGEEADAEFLRQRIIKMQELRGVLAIGDIIDENAKKLAEEQKAFDRMIDNISGSFADFLVDWVENGSSAFKRLWDSFKHWALQALAEIAAKQIIVSVLGALGLSTSGLAGASGGINVMDLASGATSIAKLAGGGADIATTVLGALGIGGSAAGASAAVVADAAAIAALGGGGATVGAAGAAEGIAAASAAGGLGELGAGLAAAGPGAALLAAGFGFHLLESSWRDKGRTSAVTYGDASSGSMPGGNPSLSPAGTQYVQAIADSSLGTYNDVMAAYGMTGDAGFRSLYMSDPKGKDPNIVFSYASVGGKNVYDYTSDFGGADIGLDPNVLEATLQASAVRSVLVALQNSDLPPDVLAYLRGTNAETASVPEIQAVISDVKQYGSGTASAADIEKFDKAVDKFIGAVEGFQTAADTPVTFNPEFGSGGP